MLKKGIGHLLVYSGQGDLMHPCIFMCMFVSGRVTHIFLIIILQDNKKIAAAPKFFSALNSNL